MTGFLRLFAPILVAAAVVVPGRATAQTCNLGTQHFFDHTGECPEDGRERCPTARMYLWNRWSYGGKQYLIGSTYTSLNFYDVSNPVAPVVAFEPNSYQPWGTSNEPGDWDSLQWDGAMLDDSNVGFAVFSHYGWVAFTVNPSNPGNPFAIVAKWRAENPISGEFHHARQFRAANGNAYVVGPYLDKSTSTIRVAPMANLGAANPSVASIPDLTGLDPLETAQIGAKWYLFAKRRDLPQPYKVAIFDMSVPSSPALVADLAGGGVRDFHVDKTAKRLYILSDTTPHKIFIYSVAQPEAPVLLSTIDLNSSGNFVDVAADNELVVAVRSIPTVDPEPFMQAFSLVSPDAPQEIGPGQFVFSRYPNSDGRDLEVFQAPNGDYGVYRAAFSLADMTHVSGGCISTTPRPAMTITNANAANAQAATCGGTSADGFPGDTFDIADQSSGISTARTFEIRRVSDNALMYSRADWTQGNGWVPPLQWTPAPLEQPGEYHATLTMQDLTGGYPLTKSVFLCSDPHAALSVAVGGQACTGSCSGLVGDAVASDAGATSGNPTDFYFLKETAVGITPTLTTSRTHGFNLDAAGTFRVATAARYAFPSAADDGCSDTIFSSLGLANNGTYDSCRVGPTIQAGTITAAITVQQGVVVVPDGGSVQRNATVDLLWSGRKSADANPTYQWTIDPAVTITNPTSATASIAPGLLASGQSYTVTQVVNNPVTMENVSAVTHFTAVDSTFTFSAAPTSVNIGDEITVTLQTVVPSDGFSAIVFHLGSTDCEARTEIGLTCGGIFGQCNPGTSVKFRYSSAASGQTPVITAVGTTISATQITSPSQVPVTVSTTGTCPSNCPTVAVSSVSPTSATVNQARMFTASASGGTLVQYTWQWGDGTSNSVTTGSSATHTYTTTGNRSLTVTAQNDCGNFGQRTQTISVGTGGGGSLTITPNRNPVNVGESVLFSFTPKVVQAGDQIVLNFGDGQSRTVVYDSLCGMTGGCGTAEHTYQSGNTFTVTGSGVAGGVSVSGSTSITVNSNCSLPSAPVANFSFSPNPGRVSQNVQFTDLSTNTPTTWSWNFGDGIPPLIGPGTSTQQNPLYKFTREGAFTVTLTATNCRGTSVKQLSITVTGQCTETQPPVADFDWQPKGPLASYPQQMQPFEGQTVTMLDLSTNNPTSWSWYDFQEVPGPNYHVKNPTHVWSSAGDKNVRLTSANCIGSSVEKLRVVTVYPDIRPVAPDFSWAPESGEVGTTFTFTAAQGVDYGSPTAFVWRFGDTPGNPESGASVTHAFTCGGAVPVTLTASRGSTVGTVTKTVTVSGGAPCGPEAVVSSAAAKSEGVNGTFWRTDMRLFNSGDTASSAILGALPAGVDNSTPYDLPEFTLLPKSTLVLTDVVEVFRQAGQTFNLAGVRVRFPNDDPAPVVASRTYTDIQGGGTYGQAVRGVQVWPNSTPPTLFITGLTNTGTTTGFRTNFGITNLRGDAGGVGDIVITAFASNGSMLAQTTIGLPPYGFLQRGIANLLGSALDNVEDFGLMIQVPPGADVEPYASLVDNLTGDPVMLTGRPLGQGALVIPGVAHVPGENQTVWRTSLQVSNANGEGRTWEIEYLPSKTELPALRKTLSLGTGESLAIDDAVAWIFGEIPLVDTSGMIRITPVDGKADMPIVAARTYNLTANGTFGQSIPVLQTTEGAAAGGARTRLLLTGMSSQDIARSNLGFVSLSGASGANFEVFFYDEAGNLLNPEGRAYTLGIGPLGSSQRKLEDRFQEFFQVALPTNMRAISAIVRVTDGGPAFVYASVVDSLTGDPVFISGEPTP